MNMLIKETAPGLYHYNSCNSSPAENEKDFGSVISGIFPKEASIYGEVTERERKNARKNARHLDIIIFFCCHVETDLFRRVGGQAQAAELLSSPDCSPSRLEVGQMADGRRRCCRAIATGGMVKYFESPWHDCSDLSSSVLRSIHCHPS